MSRADDLLKDLSTAELKVRAADEALEPNIVIGVDRVIEVPPELRKVAVQFDHRMETVTFDCPRYWDGADMSKMKIYVHYTREDGLAGLYLCKNTIVDSENPEIMHFDWTLTRNATGAPGKLTFLVAVKRVDKEGNESQHWNSSLNTQMYVDLGMDNNEIVQDKYPDIFTHMLQRMDETIAETQQIKDSALKEVTNTKNKAITEINTTKSNALKEMNTSKTNALNEMNTSKTNILKELTNSKSSAIKEITKIKNETVSTFNQLIGQAQDLMGDTQELMDETQQLMNTTIGVHNEMLVWVKKVTDIATPEAMKQYTIEYYDDHPDAIMEAIGDIYSIASEKDIDEIIAGEYTAPPDSFEEEFSIATDGDIDAIITGEFITVSEDVDIVTITDIDAIIANKYIDIDESEIEEDYYLAPETDIDMILDHRYIDDPDEGEFEEGYQLASNTNIDEIISSSYIEDEKEKLEIDKPGDNTGGNDDTIGDSSMEVTDAEIDEIIQDLFAA